MSRGGHDTGVRRLTPVLLALGCSSSHAVPDGAQQPPDAIADAAIDSPADAPPDAGPDPALTAIYNEVDADHLIQLLKDMGGVNPVTVGTDTFTIDERFSDTGRAHFRAYWQNYMTGLGYTVRELDYKASGHPRAGVDLEATLAGASTDSYVVIVHYDSIGPNGPDNPGVDDDMTGMAIALETARIFAVHKAELAVTVRFVAADEEELGGLAGARAYAKDIKALSMTNNFKLVGAIDDEQSGWNCKADNGCITAAQAPDFDIYACGSGAGHSFDYNTLGDQFQQVVKLYSPMHVTRDCMGENSDHFAMWEIGVPTLVYSEHDPIANPHFDQEGGDTFDLIDTTYFTSIARVGITFQASQVGL